MDRKNDVITVDNLPAIKLALDKLELREPTEESQVGPEASYDIAKFKAMWPSLKQAVYSELKHEFKKTSALTYEEVRALLLEVAYGIADSNQLGSLVDHYMDETIDEVLLTAVFAAKEVEREKPKRKNSFEPDDYTARVLNSYEIVPYLAGEMIEVFLKKIPEGKFAERFKAEVGEYLNQGNSSIGAVKISEITQKIIPTRRLDSEDATQPNFMAIAMLTKIYKSMSEEKVSARVESLIERFLHNETLQHNFLTSRLVNIPDKKAVSPKVFDLKIAFKRACNFLSETLDELAGGTLTYQGLMRYCEAEAASPNFKELLRPREQRQLAELLKSYASVVYMQALEPEMTQDIHKVVDRLEGDLVKNSGPRR